MTRVVYYVAASLDGFIAGPQGGLDWLHAFERPDNDYGYKDFLATIDGLVMGRKTWSVVRSMGDWPYGARPAWVLSRTQAGGADDPTGVRFTQQTPQDLRAQWQAMGLQRVWLVGGGEVAGQFLAAGCLDELVVTTIPVVLGSGVALFGGTGAPQARWKRAGVGLHPGGVHGVYYQFDSGSARTGGG